MLSRLVAIAALSCAACCSKSEVKGSGSAADSNAPLPKPTFTLFAIAELRGQIGPCGCTSDPLGDLSRTAKLVADARAAGPVLVVDAGSTLFSKSPVPAVLDAQESLKAELIVKSYKDALQVGAVGLGPADLAKGPGSVQMAREAVNVKTPGVPIDPPRVIAVGGAKVGVFGVVAVDAVKDLAVDDPIVAGKAAVADLKKQGAEVIVGLVQAANKPDAIALVRGIGGIDIAVAGLGKNAPEPELVESAATKIGDTWMVVPVNRGQILPRFDVTLRGAGPLADAIGAGAAKAKIAMLDARLAGLDADLARFASDKNADQGFVAQKQSERAQLAADRAQLVAHPVIAPANGSYFTLEQIKIGKTLACSTAVQDAVKAFDHAAGQANVAAAKNTPVPAVKPGDASYVGMEQCSDCHADAVAFWKKTVHATAWQTLVDRGQEFDYDCIGCHVTGWDKPGGTNLAHNDGLRDVQCETCHGPGSIHVKKGGDERPLAIRRNPPENLCASQCHTKEHSDTFQYEAYLRDITGPGHGADLRAKLKDGPTGKSLRSAALAKAGTSLGAGCTR